MKVALGFFDIFLNLAMRVGNDLFSRMLDPYMQYSCAYWKEAQSLEEAQVAKLDLICRKLQLEPGMRVLDMGAGVSALPLWLAQRGARVTTVDGHSAIRVPPAQPNWNEWGFLDYGNIDGTIRSHNCLMQDMQGAGPFELIYSVSVIEHIPAEARRAVLAAMKENLVPGGRLLLTLDLIPNTDQLWDLSEGVRVDEGLPHGTIADFLAELAALGFTVTEQTLFRAIEGSRTDLLMVDAHL